MSNALYEKATTAFAKGQINLETNNIKVALVTNGYTPDLTNHQYYTDIASHVATGTKPIKSLANKAILTGAQEGHLDADDALFTEITDGQTIPYAIIFQDTEAGTDSVPLTPGTARLIALLDTGTGLPITSNGGDITLQWDATNGIFSL